MSSSPWSGFIDYRIGISEGVHKNDNPAMISQALVAANNSLHLADESAQQIVSDVPLSPTDGRKLPGDGSTTLYHRYGPFDLRFRSNDGNLDAFRVRVRLAAYDTATSNTQTIRAVLTTAGFEELDRDEAGSNTADFTVPTATAATWINGSTNVLTVDVSAERFSFESERNASGSDVGNAVVTKFFLCLYNVTATTTTTCFYSGLYAAEFVGT